MYGDGSNMTGSPVRPDTSELQAFYTEPQGHLARRLLLCAIRRCWPDFGRMPVLGVGYPCPYLPVDGPGIAAMPCSQGAEPWPPGARRRVALVDETELPFADGSFERVLMIHALEHVRRPRRLLREIWRVLADGGRVLVLVPNRHGLWGWSERTPFGQGHPFTAGQLQKLLRAQLFEPVAETHALCMPPVRSDLVRRLALPTERFGLRLFPRFSGVVVMEAEKRIWVTPPLPVEEPAAARRYVYTPRVTASTLHPAPEKRLPLQERAAEEEL